MKIITTRSKPRKIPIAAHRLLITMKISILLIFIFFLEANAKTSAQTVTLNTKNISFSEIIHTVKIQTGYMVLYTSKVEDLVKPITVDAKNMQLDTFLEKLLKEQKLSFRIQDKTIFIIPEKPIAESISNASIQDITIKGKVTDVSGKSIPGVSIR